MAPTIFSGLHPLGGMRTVACPSWDGTACHCPAQPDGTVPGHLEHRWPAQQDAATSVREARLLAAEHYARATPPPHGALAGVRIASVTGA